MDILRLDWELYGNNFQLISQGLCFETTFFDDVYLSSIGGTESNSVIKIFLG